MRILKRILNYFLWTLLAFLFSCGYMFIILGPKPKPSTGFMKIFDWIYEFAFIYIGSIIGSIIALLYILIDVFYLNKRLKNRPNSTIIRFLIVMIIVIIVGTTHYILEKVVDVI